MDERTLKNLDELIADRRELVASLQKNGDRSHELLAEGLYKKRAHFITELLQNAEDEGAQQVSFELNERELIFSHDASHLFDFDDIKSISNFGDNQQKKDKPNAIGRFGIGFKSVYSITDSPRIISGDFDITIRDMCVPEKSSEPQDYFKGTEIVLPLRNTAEDSTWLENELKKLDVLCLLFLSNIKQIKWSTPNSNDNFDKISGNNQLITLKSNTTIETFLMFEKTIQIGDKKLTTKSAFYLSDKNTIIPRDKSPLFAFFPMTATETNLKFLLHAPFHTTESRDVLDETDDRNNTLLNALGVLWAECLPVLKERNFINVDFLNMLPIDREICSRNPVYSILYEAVKNEFQKTGNEFIPTTRQNVFTSVNNAMLLGSTELSGLLTDKQAKSLFGREYWVIGDITENKAETKKLYQYLYSELDIPNYDLRAFATKLTEEFLLERSNNWIVKFYKTMYEKAEGLWAKEVKTAVLRKKPIIRIEEQGHHKQVVPFDDSGKPNVYLPSSSQTKYPTVLTGIANDKVVHEFLKAFGIDYPDVFADINDNILPKLKKGEMYDDYFDDIAIILTAPLGKSEKYKRLITDLQECRFILGENYVTHNKKLLQYDNIYFPSELLVKYFENNSDIYFVSIPDSFNDENKEKLNKLLKEIGVQSESPQRTKIKSQLSYPEKVKLITARNNYAAIGGIHDFFDYELVGAKDFFENIIDEKSVILWKILSAQDKKFFDGVAKYYSGTRSDCSYSASFDAKFLRDLRKAKWLFAGKTPVAPHEITFEELPDVYKDDIASAQKFSALLKFKLDEDREYEMAHEGKKVINEDELAKLRADSDELQRIKAEKEASKVARNAETAQKATFVPSVQVADAPIRLSLYNPIDIAHTYDEHQYRSTDNSSNENDGKNDMNAGGEMPDDKTKNGEETSPDNSEALKGIGRWGEDYVSRVLHDEYQNETDVTIRNLNSEGNLGIGADFEVWKSSALIQIIEVKTTKGPPGSAVTVSGTQWETARNKYNLGAGDIYWIYCVYNAGKSDVQCVRIQNPIKQWKEGKVMANPVNFIVQLDGTNT